MNVEAERRAIRSRHTLMGNGRVATERTVRCPRRGATVLLDGCLACEHLASEVDGDAVLDREILCRGARPERPLEWPDMPAALQPYPRTGDRGGPPAPRRRPEDVLVHRVMSTEVICVSEDVSADALMALLLDRDISGVPVVTEQGRLKGVISKTDLVRDRYERLGVEEVQNPNVAAINNVLEADLGLHVAVPAVATVSDLMTPVPQAVSESSSVAQAAALMVYEGIHRLPVVARDGTVVGIIAPHDVMRWVAEGSCYVVPPRARRPYPEERQSSAAVVSAPSH